MLSTTHLALILGVTAAAADALGGAMIGRRQWERRYLRYFVALGSGFMLATALVEMVPESLNPAVNRDARSAGFVILLGYLIIHFFEHTLSPHFHFGEETHADEFVQARKSYSVLAGLLIHTFFDGIAIASGFVVSNRLGWIVFIAVFLHKLPEGFTVASVMLASGRSRIAALLSAALLGGSTLLGVLVMVFTQASVAVGLPLSAGVTIYVAASDLVPEVNKEPGVRMALVVFVGVACLFLLDRIFHLH
jgi:ZIP family zinc transporter/zinc and cadmium transporter